LSIHFEGASTYRATQGTSGETQCVRNSTCTERNNTVEALTTFLRPADDDLTERCAIVGDVSYSTGSGRYDRVFARRAQGALDSRARERIQEREA
jgi:hypothetical protein